MELWDMPMGSKNQPTQSWEGGLVIMEEGKKGHDGFANSKSPRL